MNTYNFFLPPGAMYAFQFHAPLYSLKAAKQEARRMLGVSKLPNGTQIW